MDFEARKLRVQLPCGTQTLTSPACSAPAVCRRSSPASTGPRSVRSYISRCGGWHSVWCEFGTRPTFPTQCGTTIWEDTRTIFEFTDVVQPQLEVEELDILREQLEGQLKEVITAQKQIAKDVKRTK